jgi:hypothetical protein
VPSDDRGGLDHLQTSPPTRPESRQQNPEHAVGALKAQAPRRIRLENSQLVSKSENLRLQCGAAPKTRGDHGTKADENRVHDGDDYDISRMIVNYAFADRTEYSVRTAPRSRRGSGPAP